MPIKKLSASPVLKRLFDIVASFFGIIVLSPLFILLFVLIKVTSTGPVIYKQKRVGKGNVDFTLLKFRTMKLDADSKGLITIGERDPRITSVGFLLRKYKLDELPQLLNILKGDMSFVGPRPEVRKYVDMYDSRQLKVLEIRPGLTDYASIRYKNENEILGKSDRPLELYVNEIMPAKLALNLNYLENRTFLMDIKILLKTLLAILKKEN